VRSPLQRLQQVTDAAVGLLARLAALAAALVLMGMAGLILVEIVLRSAFARSTHITEEFVGYGMASIVFLAFAQALRDGTLIRVDLVLGRLPGRARQVVEIVIAAITLAAMLFVLRFVWASFGRYWRTGAISWSFAQVPLWIPQVIVVVGIAIFCLQLAAYLLRLLTGGPPLQDRASLE
jgi:TRAP-type C4-dicarboxylate transport system permease small subunit